MNLTNKQIREQARHLLDDNVFGKDWLKSVLTLALSFVVAYVIIFAAVAITSTLVGTIVGLLITVLPDAHEILLIVIAWFLVLLVETLVAAGIGGNISVGIASVNLDLVRGDGHISIKKFFDGFRDFVENFVLGFMCTLQITLWSLLFVVPGIYVALSYALVFHVKKDHPEYTWRDCLDESERLMTGNRWRYFKLNLSFIGWTLVGTLAFAGIGELWAVAYQQTSIAVFYEQVKAEKDSLILDVNDIGSTSPGVYCR